MEQNINERILRITGSANLENDLELDQDVEILVKGSVVKSEDGSKQDGSFDRVFKVKIATAEIR